MRELFEAETRQVVELCQAALDPEMDPFAALGRLARAREHIDRAAHELWLTTDRVHLAGERRDGVPVARLVRGEAR